MGYESGDVMWLLTEWLGGTKTGGEYLTWRQLVSRYPGRSDLKWFWGLVAEAVANGYLTPTLPGDQPPPSPDSRVTWDGWQLTDQGRALVAPQPTP